MLQQFRFSAFFSFAITLALAMFLSCSSDSGGDDNDYGTSSSSVIIGGSSSSGGGNVIQDGFPFDDTSGEVLQSTPGLDAQGLSNVIKITYKNGSAPEIENDFSEVAITPTDEDVVVRIPGTLSDTINFVLSGTTTNGSLKFYGDVYKNLYLNGVNIKNSKGPAINIQKSKKVIVHLVNGTQNSLEDGANYVITPGEQAKGAFFSEGKLEFEGSGSLTVKGNYNHAITVDNDFEMNNGKITLTSVNDGVHANEMIKVKGGVLQITSAGDAIQSEKEPISGTQEWVKIVGGKIKAQTTGLKSHGIVSEGPIEINSAAIVQISVLGNGSKGIKSRSWVDIKGGKTLIKTSGTVDASDPTDESTPSGIKLNASTSGNSNLTIDGGELTIKSVGAKAKGISSDVDVFIKSGKVDIEADDDGIKVKTGQSLAISGGTVNVKSRNKKSIDGTYAKTGGTVTLDPPYEAPF